MIAATNKIIQINEAAFYHFQIEAKKLVKLQEVPEAEVEDKESPKHFLGRSGTCPHDDDEDDVTGALQSGKSNDKNDDESL